jgi:hypothetical protein
MKRYPKRRIEEILAPPGLLSKDVHPEVYLLMSKTFKDIVTDFIQENVKRFRTEDRGGYFKYLW